MKHDPNNDDDNQPGICKLLQSSHLPPGSDFAFLPELILMMSIGDDDDDDDHHDDQDDDHDHNHDKDDDDDDEGDDNDLYKGVLSPTSP